MGCCNGLSNFSLFPIPLYEYGKHAEISIERQKILFIPKTLLNGEIDYIPCFFSNIIQIGFRPNFLILFHGNAEDIFLVSNFANAIELYIKMNVVVVEYPGYSIYKTSKSNEGNIEEIILNDSLIVYDKIKEVFRINDENIFILGRSIGSAPASYLASKRNPGGLFLISAFTSIKDVINNHSFNLGGIFIKSSFETKKYINNVNCPILLIHGVKDTLIPSEQSKNLYNQIKGEIKECLLREDMTHNKYKLYEDIIIPISSFLEKHNLIKNKVNREFNLKDIKEFKVPFKFKDYIK